MRILLKLFILILCVGCSSSIPESGSMQEIKGRQMDIKNDEGTVIGTFREGDKGKLLYYIQEGGKPLEIGSCSEDVITKKKSPNNSFEVFILERNCGATVDFATQILLKNELKSDIIAIYSGRPSIEMKWIDDSHLSIERSRLALHEVFQERSIAQNVYVKTSETSQRIGSWEKEKLKFAMVNYGATGAAAGLSMEFLLRLAGW